MHSRFLLQAGILLATLNEDMDCNFSSFFLGYIHMSTGTDRQTLSVVSFLSLSLIYPIRTCNHLKKARGEIAWHWQVLHEEKLERL